MLLIFLIVYVCLNELLCAFFQNHILALKGQDRVEERQSEGESQVHVYGIAFVWMLALFVRCGECH